MDLTSSENQQSGVPYLIEHNKELPDATPTASIITYMFQPDGIWPHFYTEVHAYLNTVFPGNRIMHVGPIL
jgi:hypothetical protein